MNDSQLLWRPAEGWCVGIDFGTAYSKAAATYFSSDANTRRMMPLHIGAMANFNRKLVVPSALFLNRDRVFFGAHACNALFRANDEKREMLQSFKMLLGAGDFEQVLNLRLPRPIDPTSCFTRGELIALYLAYLLELIERAAPAELGSLFDAHSNIRIRYSRPAWLPQRSNEAYAAMEGLFRIATRVRADIGDQLLSADGAPFSTIRDALTRAHESGETLSNLDGAIYEASAVAACHFIDPAVPDHLVVADIGAGTTDFSAFFRHLDGSRSVIAQAQRTISVAGDTFDCALMNLIISKARKSKTVQEQGLLWRALRANIRDTKETLLKEGKVTLDCRGERIVCRKSEFLAHNEYKIASKHISAAFDQCVLATARALGRNLPRRIGVVLAGGGAHLPSSIEMAAHRHSLPGGVKVELLPTTPRWTTDLSSESEFQDVFAQMCVAFGTALSKPGQFQPTVQLAPNRLISVRPTRRHAT